MPKRKNAGSCLSARPRMLLGVLAVVLPFLTVAQSEAAAIRCAGVVCPLCPAIGAQTIGEGLATSDVAVIARLVERREEPAADQRNARFQVVTFLVGDETQLDGESIELDYYGSRPLGTEFLIPATDPLKLTWGDPIVMSAECKSYVQEVMQLSEQADERLRFFLSRLEDDDEVIASDAYDEFARAPYEHVVALKEDYDPGQLLDWIKSEEVPDSRRRLYFMLLGVCGSQEQLPQVKSLLEKGIADKQAGLDSIIACYLSLSGAEGLPLINERLLSNTDAGYGPTYAAIMALRFHGTEGGVIEQAEVIKSFRLLLSRPSMADLVIPDLARWKDWDSADRLAKLFKDVEPENRFVRIPIVIYMKLCPLPEAKKYMKEFEKIDADSVERAKAAYPLGG